MYYRITDWKNEPRWSGYNSTTFEELANWLFEIDPLLFIEENITKEMLKKCLENWERDFVWFLIEESKEPFDIKDLDY
jgi:hypothetical protein